MDKLFSLPVSLTALLLALASVTAGSTCYCKNTGDVDECGSTTYACGADNGSVQSCCVVGDTCLVDGFCQFSHSTQQHTSGYYLGGCTDPTFQDPKCLGQCGDFTTDDVVYNTTSSLWACCWNNGTLDCSNPGNETFQAPAPSALTVLPTTTPAASTSPTSPPSSTSTATSGTSAGTTTTTSPSSTPFTASSVAQPSPTSGASGLSTGAQVGIGVGVSLAGMLFIAVFAFLWRRKQRSSLIAGPGVRHQHRPGEPIEMYQPMKQDFYAQDSYKKGREKPYQDLREMHDSSPASEVPPRAFRGELEG